MFDQVVCIFYILLIFVVVRGNVLTGFRMYFYFNSFRDLFINLVNNHNYLYVIAEEMIFRLPLLYTNDYFWHLLLVWSMIHCNLSKSLQMNLFIFFHTLVCGYFFSKIGFPRSLAFHIFNNLLYDLHDVTIVFRKKNSRVILDHLSIFDNY